MKEHTPLVAVHHGPPNRQLRPRGWSPDGKQLVLIGFGGAPAGIFTMPVQPRSNRPDHDESRWSHGRHPRPFHRTAPGSCSCGRRTSTISTPTCMWLPSTEPGSFASAPRGWRSNVALRLSGRRMAHASCSQGRAGRRSGRSTRSVPMDRIGNRSRRWLGGRSLRGGRRTAARSRSPNSTVSEGAEIFVVQPDGTGVVQLTDQWDSFGSWNSVWSPDGSQLVSSTAMGDRCATCGSSGPTAKDFASSRTRPSPKHRPGGRRTGSDRKA
jgi:hypothetical protein